MIAGQYSEQKIAGVCAADVYILFAHSDGNGVFTEFGAALAALALQGKPRIFAMETQKPTLQPCSTTIRPLRG